jgi:hypothetical protein
LIVSIALWQSAAVVIASRDESVAQVSPSLVTMTNVKCVGCGVGPTETPSPGPKCHHAERRSSHHSINTLGRWNCSLHHREVMMVAGFF